ncbi:Bug family tripartite tricarboxylate transporter substrate binding protein [Falsiroseomonas tokyonensis]|uniref:Bug family tripartite tricarboxylate transporter substrate binding protein n=1 Tax=Falsiroseomonas tokyonensis TaxID=430521 RepID=A0ABV7C2C8_9PROT|nr:tripartite tricarboxylate transporter substrate binding protein [Falsiroseomonas tokyonensis]MBU8541233.1 tripartite tricarboxylate transporter substrate binding protein [Falsiroseomonas tokyonensis]
MRMRRMAAALALLGGLAGVLPAVAQEAWPNRPLRLVVGFPAGGPTDIPARIIAEKLRGQFSQPVVVENRSGAGGRIALDHVLAQPRDGHTLLVCTYIDALNSMSASRPYALGEMAPISQITRAYYALVVPNGLPAANVAEFVALAKARAEGMAFGHVGPASMPNLVARMFEGAAGVSMVEVPYRGTPPVLQDLIAGRLQLFVGPLVNTMPLAQAGQVRAIGVTSPQRLAVAPEVPTLVEQGMELVAFGWLGICGGAGTPPAVVRRMNELVVAAVASPEYRTAVEGTGAAAVSSTPAELERLMQDTVTQYGAVIRRFNIPMD